MSNAKEDANTPTPSSECTLALVLAGGKGTRMYELTKSNAKPALEFGGKCKVIDFPLSNCINSGIKKIGVLTHYQPTSLIRHITSNWDFLDTKGNEFIEILQSTQHSATGSYEGTAHAVFQNIPFILKHSPKYIAILAADHVYKMDYMKMLNCHIQSGSQMTVSCIEVPVKQAAGRFGVMQVDQHDQITAFDEKPAKPNELIDKPGYALASMGNYIFNTQFLIEQLMLDEKKTSSSHDFGHDIIPCAIDNGKATAYRYTDVDNQFPPYWRDIGNIDAFWHAHMDLLGDKPRLNLEDGDWPILATQIKAKFCAEAPCSSQQKLNQFIFSQYRSNSIISSTAKINKSSLGNDVSIGNDSILSETVVMPGVRVGRNVVIHKAIIAQGCDIPSGAMIGVDREKDIAQGFRISSQGIVLVTPQMLLKPYKINTENVVKLSFLKSGQTQQAYYQGD